MAQKHSQNKIRNVKLKEYLAELIARAAYGQLEA